MLISITDLAYLISQECYSALASIYWTSACSWHICTGCQGSEKGWMSKKHKNYWQSIHGQRQHTGFLKTLSSKKGGELLNLSRNQLRIMTELLTGHCHVKEHLFKLAW